MRPNPEKADDRKIKTAAIGREPGPFRCAGGKNCGCCILSEGSAQYACFTAAKAERLASALSGFCKVEPFVFMDDPAGYRHKVHLVFGMRNGRRVCGVYARDSHRIVEVPDCVICDKAAWQTAQKLKALIDDFHLEYYDEDRGTGLIRHLIVRSSASGGGLLAVLVTGEKQFPGRRNFAAEARRRIPELTTLVHNVNPKRTTFIFGDSEQVLFGPGYIEERLLGRRFRISPDSFFQVNPRMAEKLYSYAIEAAELTGDDVLLDAYCGTGTIGICAASACRAVQGVELNPAAVRDAIAGANLNGVDNIRFFRGDAGDHLLRESLCGDRTRTGSDNIAGSGISSLPDVVITDPPRSGCTTDFLNALIAAAPRRVVYVSCEPSTLVRDLAVLREGGYVVRRARGFDMFGFTEHVETVCCLYRQKKDCISVPYEPRDLNV